MRTTLALAAFAAYALTASPTLAEAPAIGKPAPQFTAVDSNGKTVSLADLKGRPVVLEWTNNGCPYVVKWYRSGAMQELQRDAAKMGAVWLTVAGSAPGEQGHVDAAAANQDTASRNAAPAHVLLDPKGEIGRKYGAQVTPHMYVIAADGTLAYMGGADSIPSTRVEDLAKAEPYARKAIEAVAAGKPVEKPVTRAYGCTIKYMS